jgi:prefoldin subunit 5
MSSPRLTSLVLSAGQRCQEKIPELEKSLSLVKYLLKKKEDEDALTTWYSLAEAVYGQAEIDPSHGIVNLWLGANVMLEYTYEEAIAFLSEKLQVAERDLDEVTTDLGFVRNQIITAEVSLSRIYNWDVRRRREQNEAEEINK